LTDENDVCFDEKLIEGGFMQRIFV